MVSAVVFLLALTLSTPVKAITIFSPVVQLEADPGENVRGVVKIYNEEASDAALAASFESFEATGETGQPAFIPPQEKNSFLSWFTIDQDSVVLKPQQAIIVPFTVAVPSNATPGGYYAAIFWQTVNNNGGPNSRVGVDSKIGTLVFLTVKGDAKELGMLEDFQVLGGDWQWQQPISFNIRFSNQGNIHLQPIGNIELAGWFGHKKIAINDEQGYVLPGSVRNFELSYGGFQAVRENWWRQFWDGTISEIDNFAFGPITAKLTLHYGSHGQEATAMVNFWYVPLRLLSLLVGLMVFGIVMIFVNHRVKGLKKKMKNDKKLSK